MKNKLKKSLTLYNKMYYQSPGAVLAIRRPYNFVPNKYPIFLYKAKGSVITDVDENNYLDMMCGYGPIVIGHRNKTVDKDVIHHIRNNGNCLTLTQPVQYELTKTLNKIYNSDKCIILKTGSDATSLSIRLARSYSGKNKILRCGYHGWHDWCIGDKFGIPKSISKDILEFRYNDLNHIETLIKKNKNQIAALIIWPVHTPLGEKVEFPKKNFLYEVKKLCKKENIVLIFDEIRSCFRMGLSGSQSIYKVKPDISVIGKAMGNGYPISAVLGSKEIMDQAISKVFVSSTFFANSVDQIAALSTIKFIRKNKLIEKNEKKGSIIKSNIIKIVKKNKFACAFSGDKWFPFISFHEKNKNFNKKLRDIFYGNLIDKKIFLAPYHHAYIMYDHTKRDIKKYLDVIEESFELINKKC